MSILEHTCATVLVSPGPLSRLLDRIAARVFTPHDTARELEGFRVNVPSRFRRRYRHPSATIALHTHAISVQRQQT